MRCAGRASNAQRKPTNPSPRVRIAHNLFIFHPAPYVPPVQSPTNESHRVFRRPPPPVGTFSAMGNTSTIDTANVTGRRELHFNSIDDALAEADRLAALERSGQLQCLGNWSCGQVFNHLAIWAEYAYSPNPLKPPFVIKLMLRMMKKRFLYAPMKVGAKIPNVENGTLGTEPCDFEAG